MFKQAIQILTQKMLKNGELRRIFTNKLRKMNKKIQVIQKKSITKSLYLRRYISLIKQYLLG